MHTEKATTIKAGKKASQNNGGNGGVAV